MIVPTKKDFQEKVNEQSRRKIFSNDDPSSKSTKERTIPMMIGMTLS